MECEICGKRIYGRALKAVIDGAKLLICSDCSKFVTSSSKYESKQELLVKRKQLQRTKHNSISENNILVEGYGQKIRKGREKLGLTHKKLSRKIGEKISLLQKLETEKMTPDLALAKKLEKTIKIKLLVPPPKIQVNKEILVNKPKNLTIGDLVFKSKNKKK